MEEEWLAQAMEANGESIMCQWCKISKETRIKQEMKSKMD